MKLAWFYRTYPMSRFPDSEMKPLNLSEGLHRAGNKQLLKQKAYFAQRCRELMEPRDGAKTTLDLLIENTLNDAPIRSSYLDGLVRKEGSVSGSEKTSHQMTVPVLEESRIERALWILWRPDTHFKPTSALFRSFLPSVSSILAYQVPMYNKKKKKDWGAIDLMAVESNTCCPVIIELKTGDSNEAPLRMVMEGVSYAIAIRKAWRKPFQTDWEEALERSSLKFNKEALNDFPEKPCRIIGMAPAEYWESWKASISKAQSSFGKLLGELKTRHHFDVSFASLNVGCAHSDFPLFSDGALDPKVT